MTDQHWSGKKGVLSYRQDEKPDKSRDGDLWYDTNDYTGEERIEVEKGEGLWRRFKKWKWGPGADYGYICGGYDGTNNFSTIDRITFPFDSGVATNVGNLSGIRRYSSANNSSIHGYICGGYDGTNNLSTIDRITFPFDSGTANNVGNLSGIRRCLSANNSSIHGYICGGHDGTNYFSTIDRITFPFDSGTANHVGNLSINRAFNDFGGNSSTHGYVFDGDSDSTGGLISIDRFQFPFDSGTANNVGNLSGTSYSCTTNNSSIHGYICGGSDESYFSTIDRITFPFDSGTATNVGNLSGNRRYLSANNSSTYGYICGGGDGTNYLSTIDRITFPFDSGTANNVGNLSGNRNALSATDGTDFVTQLI